MGLLEWGLRKRVEGEALRQQLLLKYGLLPPTEAELGQQNLESYRGLLANPDIGVAGAGNLAALLGSASPEARQQGEGLIGSYLAERSPQGQANLALTQQNLANARTEQQGRGFDRMLRALGERRETALFPQQQAALQANIEQSKAATVASEASRARIAYGLQFGDIPPGYVPTVNPATGGIENIPEVNTPDYNKAQAVVRLQEDVIRNIQKMQTLIEESGITGTELVGAKATRLNFLRGNVVAGLFALRGYGAPQAAELELALQQLPDPTSWTNNVQALYQTLTPIGLALPDLKKTIQAPYTEFRELAENSLQQLREQYWYVNHSQGLLPQDASANPATP